VAGPFGHTLDILTVLVDDVTGNPFPVGGVQPQARAGMVVELARSQASNAAQAPVIELVGDQFDFQNKGCFFH